MRNRALTLPIALVLLATACSGGVPEAGGGWLDGEPVWAAAGDGAGAALRDVAPAVTTSAGYDGATGEGPGSRPLGLSAGSVDDNAAWDDYLLYRQRFAQSGIPVYDVDVTGRRVVTVTRPDGTPVLGAMVSLLDPGGRVVGAARTTSDGTARLFPVGDVTGMQVVAEHRGAADRADLSAGTREHALVLDVAAAPSPIALDVLFLIDVTGSMGDEIDRLKGTIEAIAGRIDALEADTSLRLAMTVYRDRGDSFVTATFDFTPDVDAFATALAAVEADGGGDYPESLNEALHAALHRPEWRVDEAVSLVFLIADAPPVLTYPDDYDYAQEMLFAGGRGITIHPIASSGLDDQGEYVFRQMAQATGGRFVFLTYGADGGPGTTTDHHVDDYSVLSLDDLVVRIVEETVAPQAG